MSKFKKSLGAYFTGSRRIKLTSDAMAALLIGVVIVINVIAFALTQAFSLYLFYPDEADLSLSGNTDALFADEIADRDRVTVMFCQAEEDVRASSTGRFALTTAENFRERYPELISIEFVNIITGRNSKNEFVDLSKYQTVDPVSNKPYPIYKTSVIFIDEINGRSKVLSDTTSEGYASFYTLDSSGASLSYNGEEMMAAMIQWVLKEEHKTAYFTTTHGEIADIGLGNMLTAAGYEIDTVDLRRNNVPEDAGLIVISNPVKDFARAMEGSNLDSEIERLRTYIENGGSVYVAIDPYVEKLHMLEGLLAEYGITISETESEGKIQRNIVHDSRNAITADSFTLVCELADGEYARSIADTVAKYSNNDVIQRECAALTLSGKAEPILLSSSASETYAGGTRTDNSGSYCIGAVGVFDNDKGERGRVFVTSSIYLTATDALVTDGYANRPFIYALAECVFDADELPYGCNTVYYNTETLENLTMGRARLYTAIIMTVPVSLAVVGAVVVIRRKYK